MTKVFNKLLGVLTSPYFVGIVLSAILAYLTNFYYISYRDPEIVDQLPILAEFERLHNQSIDMRLRHRGPRKGSDDVAILTIDENAIQKYGRWPWPRSYIAKVIDDVMANGARSIAFDIIFSEKQEEVLNSLDNLNKKMQSQFPSQAGSIEQFIADEKVLQDHDSILTEVIKKHADKLIMGSVYDEFELSPFPFQDACFLDIAKKKNVFSYWDKEAYLIGVQNAQEINLPDSWHQVVLKHFDGLQQNITFQWLSANADHPLSQYLISNKQELKKKNTIDLVTAFILGEKDAFNKLNTAQSVQWAKMDSHLTKQKRVELQEQMNKALADYCLRYLTSKDELKDTFVAGWTEIAGDYDKFANLSFDQAKDMIINMSLHNPIHHVDRWLFNIPSIQEVTQHTGTFNATQDTDGSVRRAKLFVRNGNLFSPSLAFKTYLVINDYYPTANLVPNPYENPPESNIVTNVQLKNADDQLVVTIPTDYRGQLPINYAGPQKMFSYISAGEILDGDAKITIEQRQQDSTGAWIEQEIEVDKAEFLKNKNIIFGATAQGVYDLRVTPFEENFPGVETHANLLDNLIRQDYLKTSAREEYLMPIVIFGLGVLFSVIVAKLGAIAGLIVTLISLISIYLVDSLWVFPKGTVITILFPIFTILFLYTFLTFFKYFTEEKKKKQLKGTFQKYVSPEIVNEILKDPSKLELGGIKQEMTVFFSDVRGFTTISEKLDPRALSDLLNHYLTPMTAIIFKNAGTLDKYMGDAIMAFFGAPISSKHHAADACRAALQQIDKLLELQKIYAERGLPMIDIGIGINTGDMSVGNMGSETVRNYTVMGDSVNLGSRLEGINKQYGTRIIISEFTQKHISADDFAFREIDWVKVKGKNEPVRIFELMATGKAQNDLKHRITSFNSGFQFYHEQQWEKAIQEFNSALGFDAGDRTSQLYIKRCQDYMKEPPGADWDGVFTMTSK